MNKEESAAVAMVTNVNKRLFRHGGRCMGTFLLFFRQKHIKEMFFDVF